MSLFRTASMAISKKHSSKGSRFQLNHGAGSSGEGRRHTMLTQPRDSVLSNGSSDRSSSVSDEAGPAPPMRASGGDLFSYEMEELIRESWPLKCCFVVKEIMQTEIAYVQALADIIKGYLTPLYSHLLNSGESPNFIRTVFSNIVKIHQTHQELMELFQDTFTSPHDFGSSFLHLDFLNLYTLYCTSYAQGNECLERSLNENQNLRDFIEHCQRGLGHSLPLSSQLIKPVQRILKYRLLLEELNKHFDSQNPDCETIQEALKKMASVAEEINTSFTNQKRSTKAVPRAVAKRRTNQLKDLQVSRSVKGRREHSPTSSSHLGKRSVSETHLNHPVYHTESHTLPNGHPWEAPERVPPEEPVEAYNIPKHAASEEEEKKGFGDSLPSVQLLKSFFEKLGEEESREHQPTMRRAKSMCGGVKDSISTAGLESPSKSSPQWFPAWSPASLSPVKSPIKVSVLPHTPSSPEKPPTELYTPCLKSSPVKHPSKSTSIMPTSPKKSLSKSTPTTPPITSPRKSTPIISPRKSTPVTSPRKSTPATSPRKSTPVTSPSKSLFLSPKKLTPITSPSPTTSPRKSTPATSPRKSTPATSPRKSTPVISPSKSLFLSPKKLTPVTSSPTKSKSSQKTYRPFGGDSKSTTSKVIETELDSPDTSPVSATAKVMATKKISEEIKKHIAALADFKAAKDLAPRTLV